MLALWFAPVAAYQLLVSAWARSSVLVWTLLPPLVLILGESFALGTWNIGISSRFGCGLVSTTGRRAADYRTAGPRSRLQML